MLNLYVANIVEEQSPIQPIVHTLSEIDTHDGYLRVNPQSYEALLYFPSEPYLSPTNSSLLLCVGTQILVKNIGVKDAFITSEDLSITFNIGSAQVEVCTVLAGQTAKLIKVGENEWDFVEIPVTEVTPFNAPLAIGNGASWQNVADGGGTFGNSLTIDGIAIVGVHSAIGFDSTHALLAYSTGTSIASPQQNGVVLKLLSRSGTTLSVEDTVIPSPSDYIHHVNCTWLSDTKAVVVSLQTSDTSETDQGLHVWVVNRSGDSLIVSDEFQIELNIKGENVDVAALSPNKVVVVWDDLGVLKAQIFSVLGNTVTALGTPTTIDSDAIQAGVVQLDSSHVFVVWRQSIAGDTSAALLSVNEVTLTVVNQEDLSTSIPINSHINPCLSNVDGSLAQLYVVGTDASNFDMTVLPTQVDLLTGDITVGTAVQHVGDARNVCGGLASDDEFIIYNNYDRAQCDFYLVCREYTGNTFVDVKSGLLDASANNNQSATNAMHFFDDDHIINVFMRGGSEGLTARVLAV